MRRIAAGPAEQGYRPYLQAALLMGLFTFLFLCTEYLYVDVLSRMVSGDRAVLAQNEALGVSAAGFLLYPLAERSCRERLRLVLLVGLLSVGCIPLVCGGTAYRVTFPVGLVFFLLFGLLGGAVFTAAVALMPTDRYLAQNAAGPQRSGGGLRVRLEEPPVHGADHVLRDDALHHRPVTAAGWPFEWGCCWQALWERRRSRCTNSGKSSGNDPSCDRRNLSYSGDSLSVLVGTCGRCKKPSPVQRQHRGRFFDMEGVRRPEFQTSARHRRR